MMFIQSNIDQSTITGLIIHLIGAILIPLLLLNFLISLMVNNYKHQTKSNDAEDWREITRMILKIEHILLHRRKQGTKSYI
mmetsp:Transcript_22588/g.3726  ORF Transcript_22588/g.3726 Transcript_22588/m.3726 type:complete len:81 (-) Transcript_22588:147-389(-)